MFNAIIVDDEQTIRDGLSGYISRTFSDISISGVFSDGKDAIEFLEKNHVNIVLTDIMMSVKSGIDVARYVYENSPDTKVVFLSAYQEFEYAKQAIKYGVKNYLSKPIKLSELNEVTNALLREFHIIQETRNNAQKDNEDLLTLISIVKRDFYSDILLGILHTPEELNIRANKIRLNKDFLIQTQCAIFSFSVFPGPECYYGSDELCNCVSNLLREINRLVTVVPVIQNNSSGFYVAEFSGFSSCEDLCCSLQNDLEAIVNNAKENLCINAEFKILFCGMDIFEMLNYHNPENNSFSTPDLVDDKIKSMISGILSRDYQSAKDILNDLRIYSHSIPINESRSLMAKLFSKISSVIFEDLPVSSVSFENASDTQELFEKGNEALSSIFEKASETKDIENPIIAKAKKYIYEHLSDDIGLDDIAGHVYLNPVYFSRFFKQHTGQTMTEYLTKARVNLACKMLSDHKYKIHEISYACGYRSSKYFAKIFKQYTGQTPSEFSKNK